MKNSDVTSQQNLSQLVKSEKLLRSFAEKFPNGSLFLIDMNSGILFAGGQEVLDLELNIHEMMGMKLTDILPLTDPEAFQIFLQSVFRDESPVAEIKVCHGVYKVSGSFLCFADESECTAMIVLQNITDTIETKAKIQFNANILRHVTDAVIVKDMNGIINYWNDSATGIYGFTPEEMAGQSIGKILSPVGDPSVFLNVRDRLLENGSFTIISPAYHKDGQLIFIEARQSIMRDLHGEPEYVICVSRDITGRVEAENVLKESEANLQAIFQSTSQSFLLMDKEYRIIAFNRCAVEVFRKLYGMDLNKNSKFTDFLLEGKQEIFESRMKQVMTGKILKFSDTIDFPHQGEVFLEVTYSPVIRENEVIGLVLCAEDKTDFIAYKTALEKSEKKYKALVESSIDLIWTIDFKGNIIFVNKACQEFLGCSSQEVIGTSFIEFVVPEDRERVWIDITEAMNHSEPQYNYESIVFTKDGRKINVLTHAVIHSEVINGIEQTFLTGTSRDISERIKSERKLGEQNRQLRLLSSYLQSVREDERTHIAREIHDELGQQLTGIKLDLSWIHKRLEKVSPDLHLKMKETITLVDETVKSIRKIASELRPGLLDNLGLLPAIEWQCQEFTRKTGIECRFENFAGPFEVSDEVGTSIFRILQESLTNIARHSDATVTEVLIDSNGKSYTVTVKDNGKGFQNSESNEITSLGLLGMQERAAMVRGKFNISSKPEKGTTVIIEFPVNMIETLNA